VVVVLVQLVLLLLAVLGHLVLVAMVLHHLLRVLP
jgi:hypothetical protein